MGKPRNLLRLRDFFGCGGLQHPFVCSFSPRPGRACNPESSSCRPCPFDMAGRGSGGGDAVGRTLGPCAPASAAVSGVGGASRAVMAAGLADSRRGWQKRLAVWASTMYRRSRRGLVAGSGRGYG
jgi:hypothetical protein